jgi:hypothetical protein
MGYSDAFDPSHSREKLALALPKGGNPRRWEEEDRKSRVGSTRGYVFRVSNFQFRVSKIGNRKSAMR